MPQSVTYLISGPAHLPYLCVSLYTLRRYWNGKVQVFAWPESFDLAQAICQDRRIDAEAVQIEPAYRGKNSQFLHKIQVMQTFADSNAHLYLDADTKVCGKIDELLERAQQTSFCATQFCDWKSNSGAPKNRVYRLTGRVPINQDSVELTLKHPLPSLNGGVFACRARSPVLKVWEEWTKSVMDLFIADETVLHVLQAEFSCTGLFDIALGGKWNCSPKYKPHNLHDDDVVIWHYHGDSNVRLNKCIKGVNSWYPLYYRCRQFNIGEINQWIGLINNKHLRELEQHYAGDERKGVGASRG